MMSEQNKQQKYNQTDWDDVRANFSMSPMVKTKIHSLAQNLEIKEWPIKGADETPEKYLGYEWEEVQALPTFEGKSKRLDLFIDILKETMAFDDPFDDMLSNVDVAAKEDDLLGKHMNAFGIPEDFPLRFSGLSANTLELCENEEIESIGAFVEFSEKMSQSIVVGGDFKALLNALISKDEPELAKYLPFRPYHTGLHFAEALNIARQKFSTEDEICVELEDITEHFASEFDTLKAQLKDGLSLERYFAVLEDSESEVACTRILKRYLKTGGDASGTKKAGFFSRLFGK